MTGNRKHPPPAIAPAAPAGRQMAITRLGRVDGLDGIRGLAALYVVVYHVFLRAWSGYPGASHAPFWAVWLSYGRGAVAPHVALMNTALVKFTPDLAVLFAVGLLAAGIVAVGERTRSRPWAWYWAGSLPAR